MSKERVTVCVPRCAPEDLPRVIGAAMAPYDYNRDTGPGVPDVETWWDYWQIDGRGCEFPVVPGTETVFKLTPSGNLKPWATGLTTILGLAFDNRDRMYVLETSNHAGPPTPGNGDIVRIDPSGARTTIVSGLTFPTGMTMGPDGNLWVSNQGFGPTIAGFGEILRISLN